MATQQEPFDPATPSMDAEAALRLPLGAASPLWLAFGAAAVGASTWWWMTRWARESTAAAAQAFRPAEPASFAADEDETVEAPLDAVEAVAESAGLVIDPAVEAPVAVAPEPETPAALTEAAKAAVEAPAAVAEAAVEASVPVAETVAQAADEAAPKVVDMAKTAADDLTQLVGVGPKLAAALAERGVTRFEQIAAWHAKELDEIDRELNLRGRATREAWVSQARRLAAG